MSHRRRRNGKNVQHRPKPGWVKQRREAEMGIARICDDCGKRCFLSRRAAKLAMRRLREGGGSRSGPMSVYECTSGYWHFGHTPYSVQRGFRQRSRKD